MRTHKKEMIAMILAGGQGSRLRELTHKMAKPGVPFGGKFRIIDFTLSNCANSFIDTVGILTQYEPYVLNTHIGIGSPWDLDGCHGGVKALPPYYNKDGGRWYKGTANAIYENISFIERYHPEYVLILSGDHIYNMDYTKMLDFHKKTKAGLSISVKEIPIEEASRFGILSADKNHEIYDFVEKPKNPTSRLASMGIYIFNWDILRQSLMSDELDRLSDHDFGKNIIPKLVFGDTKVSAYAHKGYWRDVGTVESLWEANMDLIKEDSKENLFDSKWKVYTQNPPCQPQYISSTAYIESSLINEGCLIEGNIKKSIISTEVKIGKNCSVVESVIMPGAIIKDNVKLFRTIVMSNTTVKGNTDIKGELDDIIIVNDESQGDN